MERMWMERVVLRNSIPRANCLEKELMTTLKVDLRFSYRTCDG
jgi:hypothetical protein